MHLRNQIHAALFAIIAGGITNQAVAQFVIEKPVVFSTDHGLPSNTIRAVNKCDNGFIWVGTTEGLCRFDGSRFKVFTRNPNDSNSLFDNRVNSVLPSGDSIWVANDMGLSILNTNTNRFTSYQFSVNEVKSKTERLNGYGVSTLFKDKSNNIWIGTRYAGLYCYNPSLRKFIGYHWRAPDSTVDNQLHLAIISISAHQTNDSLIYAGTLEGLLEINRYSHEVRRFFFPLKDKKEEAKLNVHRRIWFHDNGMIYSGNWATGVHVFDPVKRTLKKIPVRGQKRDGMLDDVITKIVRKSKDEIWISTTGGLLLYNTANEQITYRKENDFSNERFYGIDFIDDRNRVWFGALNGLQVFDPTLQQFVTWSYRDLTNGEWRYNFYMIEDTAANQLLVLPRIATELFHFDLNSKKWSKLPLPVPGIDKKSGLTTRGFSRSPNGRYTISSDEGLFEYDDRLHTIRPFRIPTPTPVRQVGDIYWDKGGRLWLCSYQEGLRRWDPISNKTIEYLKEMESTVTGNTVNSIANIYEDSRRNIWVTRNNGFSVYDNSREKFYNILFNADSSKSFPVIFGFAEDKKGRIWVNGTDGWIGYVDINKPENGIVKKLNLQDQYNLGEVLQMKTDKEGNVWGYCKKFLFRIHPETLTPERYDFHYGINEAEFFSFHILNDGQLVFGGRNDIVMADPARLVRNNEYPEPYISQIQVLYKPYAIEMVTVDTSHLKLKHWQNFFSFAFSARAFTLGNNVKFRYRLAGFEDQWTETADRNFVNYTNVPPGDYTFLLQAANNEGLWNNNISTLPVKVTTAWFNTWIFRTLAAAMVIFAAWQLYIMRLRQVRDKSRIKAEFEKKLANVEMSALLAQMNPHFLFNSLNSIDSYIIKNESRKASEYLNNFARLMRLILNNSRSNYITLKDELEALELYLQMESLRFKDRFIYEISVDPAIDTCAVNIPPMLIQPYVENAIWHGLMHRDPSNGESKVKINIVKEREGIRCIIQDNGIGREKASELNARRGSRSRKSMGMRITEDRIEIINKLYNTDTRVFVEDLKDEEGIAGGTRVELSIPV